MPRKGVGEHGGVAKWRHGWIPVNAAARAIVARRKARALGRLTSEESSSVKKPRYIVRHHPSGDYKYDVYDTKNKEVVDNYYGAKAPARDADQLNRDGGYPTEGPVPTVKIPPVKVPRRRRTVPEPSRFDVRPDYKHPGQWTTFDTKRNHIDADNLSREEADAVAARANAGDAYQKAKAADEKALEARLNPPKRAKPTFVPLDVSGLDPIDGEHTAEADAINVNPMWLEARQREDPQFTANCALAVQAWEMRRRGYAVEAAPMPEYVNGLMPKEIAAGWKFPKSGATARFSYDEPPTLFDQLGGPDPGRHRAQVEKATKAWPVGARGFIACVWGDSGGGHIFNVEKQADGLHYYDPQAGVELNDKDSERYFAHMLRVATIRIDDKAPADNVQIALLPGRTEGAGFRPGSEVLDAKPTPEGLAALDKEIAWNKKAGGMAADNGRKEDAQIAETLLAAYKDARGQSPNQISTLLTNNTNDYLATRVSPDVYDTRRSALRQALKLQHPGVAAFAEVEQALAVDQGDTMTADTLQSTLLGSLPGPVLPPRITGPHDWKADMVAANPHYDHVSPMTAANTPWRQNCVAAVAAYDMRRRGFDVTAVPNPTGVGSAMGDLTINYRTPDGHVPALRPYSINEIHSEVNAWPDGAWGMADGANHLFVIQKVNGKILYLDPQSGELQQTGNDATLPYWYHARLSEKDRVFLRMDNLTPVPGVSPLVQAGLGPDVPAALPPPPNGIPPDLADVPRIVGDHSAEFDMMVTNPHFTSTGAGPFDNNCVNCSQAWELRRRGFDVTAQPLGNNYSNGRNSDAALFNWRDPQGKVRKFTDASLVGVDNIVKSWPPKSRGWIVVYWKGGGSHIFAVENGRWIDPQSGRVVDRERFLQGSLSRMKVMRTDDLEPSMDPPEPNEDGTPGTGLRDYVWPVGKQIDPEAVRYIEQRSPVHA